MIYIHWRVVNFTFKMTTVKERSFRKWSSSFFSFPVDQSLYFVEIKFLQKQRLININESKIRFNIMNYSFSFSSSLFWIEHSLFVKWQHKIYAIKFDHLATSTFYTSNVSPSMSKIRNYLSSTVYILHNFHLLEIQQMEKTEISKRTLDYICHILRKIFLRSALLWIHEILEWNHFI